MAHDETFGVGAFRKLRVWQAAQQIAIDAHRFTARMRAARTATLRDQLLRAAMSGGMNVVEGNAHASPREVARFLQSAIASVSEGESLAQLVREHELVLEKDYTPIDEQNMEVRKMRHGLLKKRKSM